ncbi:MAG: hypothetical protein QXI09_00805 [Candidatus Aenigmatarchaeota archaeon]
MRCITQHAIFVTILIGFFTIMGIIVFWKWFSGFSESVSETACRNKLISYCLSIIGGEKVKWEDINPKKGCENYNIVEPTKEECEKLFK